MAKKGKAKNHKTPAASPVAAAPLVNPSVSAEPQKPTISLCMIVKDEEDWIAQAISSVRSIVSEVIVVDTGSTDRTIEIAKSLGARIFTRAWDDDFSAARNYSLEQATCDWILVLDADEAIDASDLDALAALTRDRSICWEFLQRHYSNDHRLSEFQPVTGQYPLWERGHAGFFESNLCRLFPNHRGIHYQGRVHELVEHSIRTMPDLRVQRTAVRIQHFGHTDQVLAKKDKSKLYTPLGQAKIGEVPSNWQAFFELAVEHNRNGRYPESVAAFLQSLTLFHNYVPSWVNLGYVFCEMGRYRQAEVALLGAIEIDPKADEAFCNLGVVYMRTNQLPKAERAFRQAIALNPKYINAYCNLGKTLTMLKRLPEAVAVYQRTIEIMPQCSVALADLGAIYLSQQMFQEAEQYLGRSVSIDSNLSRSYFHLGQLFRATGRVNQAVDVLKRFCSIEENRLANGGAPQEIQFVQQVRGEIARFEAQRRA